MISQLLDFARIRQGMSLPIEPRAANLHDICRNMIEETQLGIEATRPIRLDARAPGEIVADPDRIAEALGNLLGNAIQHGTEGPITVTVHEAPGDEIAVEVHNLGPPIPSEAQAHIFDAFQRGHDRSEESRSLGLGLFIAREIARAHGGSISVRSPDREGTSVTLLLPRKPQSTAGGERGRKPPGRRPRRQYES